MSRRALWKYWLCLRQLLRNKLSATLTRSVSEGRVHSSLTLRVGVLFSASCLSCVALPGCGGPSDPNSKNAADFVLQKGGSLFIVGSSLEVKSSDRLPEAAFVIREIILNEKKVSDDDLQKLTGLMHLTVLELHSTNITDGGLKHLSGLTTLKRLELSYTRITDKGLEHLAPLKGLQKLFLHGTNQLITNEAITQLKQQLSECEVYR